MDVGKLCAWWAHRQGLDGSLAGVAPEAVLQRSGWARSVAGVGPYFTLFARAGTSRAAADEAVAACRIHELPAARGCTYVVPRRDFVLALRAGQPFEAGELRTALSLGVTEAEIAKLCDAVERALADGPRDPEAIRGAVGNAARSLGEAGKKKGLTTTLPLALGRLQAQGIIRRIPENGRLDQQRYRYARWPPNPLLKVALPNDAVATELARLYFCWIGPARLTEFQWFCGLGVKAAKAAVEPLRLEPVAGDWLLPAMEHDAFRGFRAPRRAQYVLVSSLDAMAALRRDASALVDEVEGGHELFRHKSGAAMFTDLPHHAILDRGRLVGFWEYDPESARIVWTAIVPKNEALREAVARAERFVRDDLGDARSFSLDSPKARAPRIAALRKAAGA